MDAASRSDANDTEEDFEITSSISSANPSSSSAFHFHEQSFTPFCLACAEGAYCTVADSFSRFFFEQEWMSQFENVEVEKGILQVCATSASVPHAVENVVVKSERNDFALMPQSVSVVAQQQQTELNSEPESHKGSSATRTIPTRDLNGSRKRYSRFRSKTHVCDFCNKSFTLKQNVQTHMSLYHMSE